MMKELLKTAAVAALGLVIGLIAVRGYSAFTAKETAVLEGDYSEHVERAGEEIVMYGTTTCPYCDKARDFFDSEGATFAEVNVDREISEAARALFESLGAPGVPVVVSRDRRIIGFVPDEYEKLLQ